MTQIQPQTTRRFLAVAISAVISGQALALEAISDEDMSAATGEGIAFLPEDFSVRLNGADNTNGGTGTPDTGYIRIIPVGPLTLAAQDTNRDGVVNASDNPVGKGDIFLYGAAISQSNQAHGATRTSADWNSRFGRGIDTWGTAANPFLLRVATENNVPDFAAATPTSTTTGSVSFLGLEAPLYHANVAALSAAEKSAYNLKAAFWTDAFVRSPSVVENMTATGSQFDVGGAGRANRLRLQAVWDGFSVNGSQVRIFQTLGGAATGVQGMSSSYNNTLGIAGLLRFNGGDGQTLRANVTTGSATRNTPAWTDHSATFGCGTASVDFNNPACQFRFRSRTLTDSVSDVVWNVPTLPSTFRLSTRETTNTGVLLTPAINGGSAPTFDAAEGLYIYNLNMNLVLGSLYQPLTVGVAPDGKNIALEIARIPNKESIYKKIYTDYTGVDPTYLGSTCNIYRCGTTVSMGGVSYQVNPTAESNTTKPTHSSITIGSTNYNATNNTLTAHSGSDALGISFGQLQSRTQAGPFTTTRFQLEFQQRQRLDRNGVFTDRYRLRDTSLSGDQADPFGGADCGGATLFGGGNNCFRWVNRQGFHTDWSYLTSNSGGVKVFGDRGGQYVLTGTDPLGGPTLYGVPTGGAVGTLGNNTPPAPFVSGLYDCVNGIAGNNCDGAGGGTDAGVYGVGPNRIDPRTQNRNWAFTTTRDTTWFVASSNPNSQENLVFRNALPAFANTPTAIIPATPTVAVNPSPLNNYGSAVIDGLLIQHLKFTTKGL